MMHRPVSSHGIGLRQTKEALPIVFVRRITHHQVLCRCIDVSQTPLEHMRHIQGCPAAVAKRLRRYVYGNLRGKSRDTPEFGLHAGR